MAENLVLFVALIATTLVLGGALAHLLELPNKIGISQTEYFTVQQIYSGWNQLGYVIAVQFVALVILAVMFRRDTGVFGPVVVAIIFLIAAQLVFWIYTYPANRATTNWTQIPENWEVLRRQWEYSHAAGAVFQLLAFSSLAVAMLTRRQN